MSCIVYRMGTGRGTAAGACTVSHLLEATAFRSGRMPMAKSINQRRSAKRAEYVGRPFDVLFSFSLLPTQERHSRSLIYAKNQLLARISGWFHVVD